MGDAATVVRTGRKFDQVLTGAREVFLSDGFEGASVDQIARAAGVSKATLYSYFPDKRHLFMEVAKAECLRMAEETTALIDTAAPVQAVLLTAATEITQFLISPFGVQIFRICIAESERFPELGATFYENGPQLARARLTDFLLEAQSRGDLVMPDAALAAEQFSELCKVRLWPRAISGQQSEFTREEICFVAREAVETFLARFGASQQQARTTSTPGVTQAAPNEHA